MADENPRRPRGRAAANEAARLPPWRVDKTMLAGGRGAIKLGRRYGAALVCVRYRLSPDGSERMTTVELIVDRTPVVRRSEPLEAIHLYRWERNLERQLKALGAQFDAATRTWFVPRTVVRAWGLADRIALDQEAIPKEHVPPDGTC